MAGLRSVLVEAGLQFHRGHRLAGLRRRDQRRDHRRLLALSARYSVRLIATTSAGGVCREIDHTSKLVGWWMMMSFFPNGGKAIAISSRTFGIARVIGSNFRSGAIFLDQRGKAGQADRARSDDCHD